MTARRLILCLTTVMVLSACGEGGGNDTPSATESLAIETYVGSELSPDEQRCILEGAEVLDIELGRITADDLMALTREPDAVCQTAVEPYHVESSGATVMRPRTKEFWAVWGLPSMNEYQKVSFAR